MAMTSVTGHLMELEFHDAFRKWGSCDPAQLYDAPVEKRIPQARPALLPHGTPPGTPEADPGLSPSLVGTGSSTTPPWRSESPRQGPLLSPGQAALLSPGTPEARPRLSPSLVGTGSSATPPWRSTCPRLGRTCAPGTPEVAGLAVQYWRQERGRCHWPPCFCVN